MSARAPAGIRDRALFATLWRTGMRISEALNLRERDLHESTGFIRIRRGRNGRGRDVVMFGSADSPTWAWDQLRPWREKRRVLGIPRDAPVFCTYSMPTPGKSLASSQVRDSLKRYVERAGLGGQRFHLHGFRHTLAAELYRGDVKLARIKHQLGHSSLAITQTYLADVLGIPEAMDELSAYRPAWHAQVGTENIDVG